MNFLSQELEELYHDAPCGYHSLDSEGNLVRINNTELKMLGYSREEVLGRKFSELLAAESLLIFEQNFSFLKQQGWINELELKMRRKDGTVLFVAVSATAIKDEAGNFVMSHSVVTDISERKRMEAALQESEEYFSALFNLSGVGIAQIDINTGGFLKVNQSFCEIVGYTKEELLSLTVDEINHSEEISDRQNYLNLLPGKSISNQLEKRYLRKDGSTVWVLTTSNIIRDEEGQPIRAFAIIQDISKLKQAENQLREISNALSNAVEGISKLDTQGRYIFVNEAYARMVGYTPEEMIGMNWEKTVNLEDLKSVNLAYQQMLQTGKVELQARGVRKDSSVFYKQLFMIAIYDEQEKLSGHYCFMKDISDAKQREAERQQAEAILKQQVAREHLLAEVTQAIHEVRGSFAQAKARSFSDQTHDVEKVLQIAVERIRQFLDTDRAIVFRFAPDWSGKVVAESVASGAISILESEIIDPCFGERYIEPYRQGRVSANADFRASDLEACYKELMARFQVRANLVVPILQQDNLWGLLISHHCSAPRQWLTEEIELLQQLATQLGIAIQQAELYQNNAQQAALIDIASDAIFVRDLSNRILFWSQGAEKLYGWKAEEAINKIAHELFHQESPNQLENALRTTITKGNWSGELKQQTKDGREIMVESRWTLTRYGERESQSILVVNSDITEKKQLEQQLLHAQRLESIGTLAGGIAHDLNNILTPILGFTQLLPLMSPNLEQSSLDLLQLVRNNVLRASDIVKQVLLFSREIEAEWELVNLSQVLEEVLQLIRETFPKSITIEDSIATNLWQLYGDSTQIHQVLMNLCVNAHDAMPDGGKLIISAENLRLDKQYSCTNSQIEVGNYILVSVTDTGMGIPAENINRIFDPFFTTKKPGRGTGLGLSTVIGIVKNHGGTIEVKSDRRNGTQFQLYLPASAEIAVTEVKNETIPFGEGELILLVDDEALIREVTKATLEKYNYRVITASDGIEAIAIFAQQPQEIAVVLMDLMMPEMDGITAMRALKKINPQIKLIAMSGLATKEKITTAEAIGIKAFLVKPYTAEKLLLNLKEAIRI